MPIHALVREFSATTRAALTFLTISVLAGVSSFYSFRYFENDMRQAFNRDTARLHQTILGRLEVNTDLLLLTQGLFSASREVTREEFIRFTEAIEFQRHYPGSQGLGFALKVRPADRARIEAQESRHRPFRIWPGTQEPLALSVYYLQPHNEMNARAIGFDMYSEPLRKKAMERAIDTGRPAVTEPVKLVQERDNPQPGFLIYVPVYRTGAALSTLEERREALVGLVYSPFRAQDLFDSIAGKDWHKSSRIDFEIYASPEPEPSLLLYDHDRLSRSAAPGKLDYQSQAPLQMAGSRWTIRFTSLPGYRPAWVLWIPAALFMLGLGISAIVGATILRIGRRAAEEKVAKDRLQLLYDSSQRIFGPIENADELYSNLIRAFCPSLADVAAVIPLDMNGRPQAELSTICGRTPELKENGELLMRSWTAFSSESRVVSRVIRTGEPALLPEGFKIPPDQASDPRIQELLERFQPRSLICVALKTPERIYGVLALMIVDSEHRYGSDDLELVTEVARRAGVAIENTQLYQNVQEAVQIRDNFISIASHELKTPLTTLTLQNQIARRYIPCEAPEARLVRYDRLVDVYENQVTRLVRLVEDMLDAARLRIGKLELLREEFDLSELAREVVERLSDQLSASGCTLKLEGLVPARGRWDRFRMDQVITNLLTNAMKYGAGKPVELTIEDRQTRATLGVRDHGMGIAPENQERVFERYERAISSRHISGLGLGLYIAREIVEAHGGRIRLESEMGIGSTFLVDLPKS